MKVWGIVLAAGRGTRLEAAGLSDAKQFIDYHGTPLYWTSALTMSHVARLSGIIFVFAPDRAHAESERIQKLNDNNILGLPWRVATGGAERQDSVCNALALLEANDACDIVLIHDSARPFASPALYNRILDGLVGNHSAGQDAKTAHPVEHDAHQICGVIPAIAVTDTIKEVQAFHAEVSSEKPHCNASPSHEIVVATPDRHTLRAVQTPQGFKLDVLRKAHAKAKLEAWHVTDDAALLERCQHTVLVVEGEAANIKITNPEDLTLLQHTTKTQPTPCVGWGYDVHRYGKGRPMRLGGIPIDQPAGKVPEIIAHSDGDVLLHALCDALLGCIGAGDIGQHFPDSDAAYDNASSVVLLDKVLTMTRDAGLTITHVDMTIIAQIPRLAPYRDTIRNNIARLLNLPINSVNFKATTEEGLGFTGEKLGMKAVAAVTGLRL
ncbi:MAG: 2-C-methyl-D-erythritol 2,4-cyclodiphosphate synthase [Pseudomonadota bacterium]